MHTHILVSSLLLLVLLRNLSAAGAIRERRGTGRHGREGSDGPALAKVLRMSDIHFLEPQDSSSSSSSDPFGAAAPMFMKSEQQRWDAAPGTPARTTAPQAPEVRPLLDEDKLVQFDASAEKNVRPPTTEDSANEESSEPPAPSAALPGAAGGVVLSQLSEILKEFLNAAEDKGHDTTTRPFIPVDVPVKPSSPTAHSDNEFDKFLPHLEEALMTALQKEASEKHPPSTTTRRPPPTPDSSEQLFKDILPALQEQIGSILEKSKDDQPTPDTFPTQQPTPTPSPPTLPTSIEFDDFLPELERVLSGFLQNTESDPNNELGTNSKRPSTARNPLSSGGTPSNTSAESPSHPSEQFLQALESSLADILKDETSQPPASLQKPANLQENEVVPQAKIVHMLEKYYPPLKKLLEEIVSEEEAISARPPPPPSQNSRTFDGVEHKAAVQALYKTVKGIFDGQKDSSAASLNTGTRLAGT